MTSCHALPQAAVFGHGAESLQSDDASAGDSPGARSVGQLPLSISQGWGIFSDTQNSNDDH